MPWATRGPVCVSYGFSRSLPITGKIKPFQLSKIIFLIKNVSNHFEILFQGTLWLSSSKSLYLRTMWWSLATGSAGKGPQYTPWILQKQQCPRSCLIQDLSNIAGPVWFSLVRFGLVRSGPEGPQFGRSDRTLIWRWAGWAGKGPYLMCSVIPAETTMSAYMFDPPLLSHFGFFDSFLDCFWGSKWWRLATGWAGKGPQCAQWCLQKQPCLIPPYSRPFYFYSCLFTY